MKPGDRIKIVNGSMRDSKDGYHYFALNQVVVFVGFSNSAGSCRAKGISPRGGHMMTQFLRKKDYVLAEDDIEAEVWDA